MKYGNVTLGQIEAVWNKLGGEGGVDRFLRGETTVRVPDRSWREQDGVIYFTVVSDGTTGKDWVTRLESKGMRVSDLANSMLCSPDFKPTSGVTYYVAVLKSMLYSVSDLVTYKIRNDTERRQLSTPNAEIACLIRDKFTDKDIEAMGLTWIIVMHNPIADSAGNARLFGVSFHNGSSWLDACLGSPTDKWGCRCGFAFVVSQIWTLKTAVDVEH